jgi:hypothetical protein
VTEEWVSVACNRRREVFNGRFTHQGSALYSCVACFLFFFGTLRKSVIIS